MSAPHSLPLCPTQWTASFYYITTTIIGDFCLHHRSVRRKGQSHFDYTMTIIYYSCQYVVRHCSVRCKGQSHFYYTMTIIYYSCQYVVRHCSVRRKGQSHFDYTMKIIYYSCQYAVRHCSVRHKGQSPFDYTTMIILLQIQIHALRDGLVGKRSKKRQITVTLTLKIAKRLFPTRHCSSQS